MSESTQWFEQGLGARIDALEVALGAYHNEEDADASVVKNLAHSLSGPAALHGYDSISKAARTVADSGIGELDGCALALIDLLRQEASKTPQAMTTILLVGGEEDYNRSLCEQLDYPSRNIVCVDDANGAEQALGTYDVVFVILNLFLPDLDARTLFQRLQETPKTAGIPVLILAKDLPAEVRSEVEALDGDVLTTDLPTPEALGARVNARLRRAHETAKEARRDPATGLLNRAALKERFLAVIEETQETGIPISLALITLDNGDVLFERLGSTQRVAIMSRVGTLLSASLRSTDVLARWGTHEFAALFPGEDQVGSVQAVDKVVQAIRNVEIPELQGTSVSLTLSAGVALASSDATLEDCVAEADRYLFQATSQGGNRVGSSQVPAPTRTEQVLLLVQDSLTCHVMQHLLERDGFIVTALNDLDTPLAAVFETNTFNLIVVDEAMPPRGGFEILKALRAMPRNSRTPMVMLIDKNSEDSMAHALELGANDYMMRPFSPFTFIRRMRRLLRGGSRHLHPHVGGEVCKVLLVDDDSRFLLIAASALHQRRGFHPFLALGTTDAKGRIGDIAPDLILLKAELQDDPGGDFVREILATSATSDTSVILMAPQADTGYRGEALKGTIQTPINALSLGQQIEETLRMSRGTRHPDDAAKHLNTEMQRITQLAKRMAAG